MTHEIGVGLDWGSSNARAWSFDKTGNVIAKNTLQINFADAGSKGFSASIDELMEPLSLGAEVPVVACGMIGARNGWYETSYTDVPVALNKFLEQPVAGPRPGFFILPGVLTSSPAPDIMRGEETQVCGATLLGYKGRLCLPGTHSKWVQLENGAIAGFSTFVTGELFALSRRHAIYGALIEDGPPNWDSFRAGIVTARDTPLMNAVFQARSRVLCGALSRQESYWFLSGCLIGSEIVAVKPDQGSITLIADGELCDLYAAAFQALDCEYTTLSAERCTTHALYQALQYLREKVS